MKCPKCGIDLMIQSAYDETVVEGDTEYTYTVRERMCPNPRCENYLDTVDVDRKIIGVKNAVDNSAGEEVIRV